MEDQQTAKKIQLSPHQYFKKALALARLGKGVDAIQHIDCAIIFSSYSPFYIYQKIKILFEIKDWDRCSSYIFEQISYLYKHASLYIVCRVLHYYQLINEAAAEDLAKLLAEKDLPSCLAEEYQNILDAKTSEFFYHAKKASTQDHYQLCIDYCELLIKLKKSSWEMLYLAAYAYHMIGGLHKACEYYKKCITLNSEYDRAFCDLGLALMELNLFEEALTYLNKARYLHPGNIDYLSYIAECYYCLRQYALAQETHESIMKIYPSRLQTYFNLSHICKRQDKKALSKKYMKVAQKRIKK